MNLMSLWPRPLTLLIWPTSPVAQFDSGRTMSTSQGSSIEQNNRTLSVMWLHPKTTDITSDGQHVSALSLYDLTNVAFNKKHQFSMCANV